VSESLKVHPTARLPDLGFSGREPEGTPPQAGYPVWQLVSESLKAHPTVRLPGLAVSEQEPEGTPHSQATRSEG
jgi:hypothetical protein